MSISTQEVEYVANLSRIKLDPEALKTFAAQLGDIVAYIDKLNELDTSGVEPLTNASGLANVLRADELRPSLDRTQALANSPDQAEGHYRVPKVID